MKERIGGFTPSELAEWANGRLTGYCKNDQGRVDPSQCSSPNCHEKVCRMAEAVADHFVDLARD